MLEWLEFNKHNLRPVVLLKLFYTQILNHLPHTLKIKNFGRQLYTHLPVVSFLDTIAVSLGEDALSTECIAGGTELSHWVQRMWEVIQHSYHMAWYLGSVCPLLQIQCPSKSSPLSFSVSWWLWWHKRPQNVSILDSCECKRGLKAGWRNCRRWLGSNSLQWTMLMGRKVRAIWGQVCIGSAHF